MANTYTQLHIQMVFAVKGRASLIHASWKEELYQYITGIVQNHDHKMLQINGMPDHIHIFIGYNPKESLSGLVETIKTDSNHFVKRKGFCPQKFSWQEQIIEELQNGKMVQISKKYVSLEEIMGQ